MNTSITLFLRGWMALLCCGALVAFVVPAAEGFDPATARAFLRSRLPAVLAAQKGLNEQRYASLKGIMAAKRKPMEEKSAQGGESRLTVRKLAYPPERPAGRIVGEGPDAAPELVRLLREEAKTL